MISCVIPVRNGMPWLEEQLQALADQECDEQWEVVVADNGSTDGQRCSRSAVGRTQDIPLVDASGVREHRQPAMPGSGAKGDLLPSVMPTTWCCQGGWPAASTRSKRWTS